MVWRSVDLALEKYQLPQARLLQAHCFALHLGPLLRTKSDNIVAGFTTRSLIPMVTRSGPQFIASTLVSNMAGSMPPKERDSLLPSVLFFQILLQLRRDGGDPYIELTDWIGQNCNRNSYYATLTIGEIRQPGWQDPVRAE